MHILQTAMVILGWWFSVGTAAVLVGCGLALLARRKRVEVQR